MSYWGDLEPQGPRHEGLFTFLALFAVILIGLGDWLVWSAR